MHDDLFKDDEKYLKGPTNWLIRYYYYLTNGVGILNEFRNLFLGILAVYIALHLSNIWWLVVMLVPSVVILTIVGYYQVHKISKVKDWLQTRFSSYFGMKSVNYIEANYEILVEIRDLLRNSHK